MNKISALILSAVLAMPAAAGTPPYFTKDPATNENFRDIHEKLSSHQHDNDGTLRMDTVVIPPRADIEGAIISKTVGQVYFDTNTFVTCISTAAASSTAWVIQSSTSTPCPN